MDILGKRIKAEREKRKTKDPKWTQGYVSDLLGTARTTYTAYENGTKQPPVEIINKIADLFDVSTDYLHGRTDHPLGVKTGSEESFDSLAEITKIVNKLGLEQFGFFDIEKWRNLSPEDVDEIRRHFEWVAQKAKERNEEQK
jgi:HTH-type transcriptional regulator, competence development regulator